MNYNRDKSIIQFFFSCWGTKNKIEAPANIGTMRKKMEDMRFVVRSLGDMTIIEKK